MLRIDCILGDYTPKVLAKNSPILQIVYMHLTCLTAIIAAKLPYVYSDIGVSKSFTDTDKLEITAFGDWGLETPDMIATMAILNKKFPSSDFRFLLGDNFYTDSGIKSVTDPLWSLFTEHVAPPGINITHFAILGNHDYKGDVTAQITYSRVNRHWFMPHQFYFVRFERPSFNLCAWFLDSQMILRGTISEKIHQLRWLEQSLSAEDRCTWKVVSAHHPAMHATGKNRLAILGRTLVPILTRHGVDLFLSGHEHNSQVIRPADSRTTYLVAGQIMNSDLKEPSKSNNQDLLWEEHVEPAFLALSINSTSIEYSYHSGIRSFESPPIYKEVINRNDTL